MNKRIFTELYKKAWGHFPCPTGESELEKFAELIVRECAETVKNSIWHLPRGYKAEDQAEFVKKHFGVEE